MATTVETAEQKVHLRFLVDKQKYKVIFPEADKDFVDILFSFLTLPLGTIVTLLNKCLDSSPTKIGSLSTLEWSKLKIHQNMLLNPRKSSEAQCRRREGRSFCT